MDLMEARNKSHALRKSQMFDVVIDRNGATLSGMSDKPEIDLDAVLAQNTGSDKLPFSMPTTDNTFPAAPDPDRPAPINPLPDLAASTGRAVGGGVQDAVLGLAGLGEDIAETLETTTVGRGLGYIIPGLRNFNYARENVPGGMRLDQAIDKGLQDMGLRIPEGDGAIESLARGLVQFGAGMAAAPVRGAGFLNTMLKSGFADAMFDPEDGNLSTLLRDLGLDNAVLEYLDSRVDEDADAAERLEGRFKQALEGLGLGLPIDMMVTGFRIAKSSEGFRGAIREKLTNTGQPADARGASTVDSAATDVVTSTKNAGDGKLSSKAQDAASKLSNQFGVDFKVSNHTTSYGKSTYVSGRIIGPDGTFSDVGFRLSDHSTGDKRKATDDFLTIIDGDDISPESLISEVQSQIERAKPKMDALTEKRQQTRATQADALDRWAKLSGDERGEIASKFKEKKSGYASNVPWRNLTKQQKADFASRENLFDGGG